MYRYVSLYSPLVLLTLCVCVCVCVYVQRFLPVLQCRTSGGDPDCAPGAGGDTSPGGQLARPAGPPLARRTSVRLQLRDEFLVNLHRIVAGVKRCGSSDRVTSGQLRNIQFMGQCMTTLMSELMLYVLNGIGYTRETCKTFLFHA